MNITDQGENDKWDDNKYTMEDFIAERTANLSRGIVATPTEELFRRIYKSKQRIKRFLANANGKTIWLFFMHETFA